MDVYFSDIKSGALSLLGIVSRRLVFSGPRLAALILSRQCNSKCIMCWYHSPLLVKSEEEKKEFGGIQFMDYELCEKIIRELHSLGTYRIVLGGHGEPTLHPQFDKLLDLIIEHRMSPYVISNGLTLDKQRARLWAKKRAYFRFSMHAGDVETWLKIHPECTASQFEEISQCIKLMTTSNIAKVATMNAVQKSNFNKIRSMIKYAHMHGIKDVQFFPVRTDGHLPQVVLEAEEEYDTLKDLDWCHGYAKKNGIATNINEYLSSNRFIRGGHLQTQKLYEKMPCYIGWIYTEFDTDGLIRPCENSERVMGHANEEGICDVWNSTRYHTFRREALMISRNGNSVRGCVCENCPMSKFNINIHNLLHFKSFKYNEA